MKFGWNYIRINMFRWSKWKLMDKERIKIKQYFKPISSNEIMDKWEYKKITNKEITYKEIQIKKPYKIKITKDRCC